MLGAAALPASAVRMDITVAQVGADVLIAYPGAVDLTGRYFRIGAPSTVVDCHDATGPWNSPVARSADTADVATGDRIGMADGGRLCSPADYALPSGSAQFNNSTLAALGFPTSGSTTQENNTIVINGGAAQAPADVPVPAARLLLSGLGPVAALRRGD